MSCCLAFKAVSRPLSGQALGAKIPPLGARAFEQDHPLHGPEVTASHDSRKSIVLPEIVLKSRHIIWHNMGKPERSRGGPLGRNISQSAETDLARVLRGVRGGGKKRSMLLAATDLGSSG